MGLTDSKPVTSANAREEREKAKADLVTRRKAQLESLQGELLSSASSASSTSVLSNRDTIAMIRVAEKARSQLDRGGGPLTKADLVAIVLALHPEMRSQIVHIEGMTSADLNSTIRGIIYDPSRVYKSSNDSQVITSNNLSLTHS